MSWHLANLPGIQGGVLVRRMTGRAKNHCELRVGNWLRLQLPAQLLRDAGATCGPAVEDPGKWEGGPAALVVRLPEWTEDPGNY